MAKSFNQLATDFTTLNNDSNSLATGKILLNIGIKKFLALSDWSFNRDTQTYSTGTGVQDFDRPYNASKIEYVKGWYGNRWYPMRQVLTESNWLNLNSVYTTSTIPTHWFINEKTGKISVFPVSADSKGTIRTGFTKKVRDYNATDYSTGSINASSGGTYFIGANSPSWGTIMQGRFLQVGGTSTPADGFWFEIQSVGSTTAVYVKERIPNAISNGTYLIAELLPFPDGFEQAPLNYALSHYYQLKQQPVLAREYERMYKEEVDDLLRRDGKTTSQIFEKYEEVQMDVNENPWNLFIEE